jgi:hypothetical protein
LVPLKEQVNEPFHTVHLDLLGPLPISNNYQYLAVLIDDYSKYCVAFPLVKKSADHVASKMYNEVILKHGSFRVLRSDAGGEFLGNVMAALMQLMGVTHRFSSGYTSLAQGKIERTLQTLANGLRTMVQGRKSRWADFVQSTVFAFNTLPLGDSDLTPFLLLYGRLPRFPTAMPPDLPEVAERTRSAVLGTILQSQELLYEIRDKFAVDNQQRRLKYVNMRKRDSSMDVGSMVFLKTPPGVGVEDNVHRFKWEQTFLGPLLCISKEPNNIVRLKDLNTGRYTTPVHMSRLKYHEKFDVSMYLALCEWSSEGAQDRQLKYAWT